MRFLITAGGTREYIDPVRFISNASSGKMGYALAGAALKAGHEVTLITAPTALKPPAGAEVIRVENAAQMFAAVKEHFGRCDCLIMAAAVADYTPAHPAKTKIKKNAGGRFGGASGVPKRDLSRLGARSTLHLDLKPTPDILKWAGRHGRVCKAHHKPKIVVGFALEDRNLRANAERKMRDKKLDMIIANAPGAIGAETSTLHIKTISSDWVEISNARKTASAARIVRMIEEHCA